MLLPLKAHPTNKNRAIRLQATLHIQAGAVHVDYYLSGDLSTLHVPPPCIPRFRDGLWQDTCFELFVGPLGTRTYREFNISPSGAWAIYDFSDWRQAAPPTINWAKRADCAPQLQLNNTASGLQVSVRISSVALQGIAYKSLQCGVSAVLAQNNAERTRSFWALAHYEVQPDFHDRRGFVAYLEGELGKAT